MDDSADQRFLKRRERLEQWKRQKEAQRQLQQQPIQEAQEQKSAPQEPDQESPRKPTVTQRPPSPTRQPPLSPQKNQVTTSGTINQPPLPTSSHLSLNSGTVKPPAPQTGHSAPTTLPPFKVKAPLSLKSGSFGKLSLASLSAKQSAASQPMVKPSVLAMNAVDEEQLLIESQKKKKIKLLSMDELDQPESVGESSKESGTAQDSPQDDPLDTYMNDVKSEVKKIQQQDALQLASMEVDGETAFRSNDIAADEEEYAAGEEEEDILALAAKKAKKKDLQTVDHSQIAYEEFRKDFYVESPELARMTDMEVNLIRAELDNIKIRGVRCPKPVKKWTHCGLPIQCEHVIKGLNFGAPTAIQAQAIPAIMSGRDVIGVARTGSGKTMAFLLPMFRHIKDQRPLENMEGPIAVIMTPTRELAMQIHSECKRFTKIMNMRAICAYGGAPIKDQIADMKRGAEIVVCTPGRLIDLLCANSGRVTNLKRVTYLVLDEADRMFDMGFEQQVMKIIGNIRPDAQRVLFSATFPKQMEALARKVLKKPLEITVGGRSIVCADVTQLVEQHDEDTKFLRLLEILGKWYDEHEDQRMLVFVDRQEAADNLLRELFRRGYRCLSLHGGMDQMDRDSTIHDFKSGAVQILIATSVAARGLDVKELNIVVNYDCPNHMEDYVHRVGRTGRAGRKGTAFTFITKDQDRFVPDIYQALIKSGATVPDWMKKMKDEFLEKVQRGEATPASSGFGGKGLEKMEKDREMIKRTQKKTYGGDDEQDSDEDAEDTVDFEPKVLTAEETTVPQIPVAPKPVLAPSVSAAAKAAQDAIARINASVGKTATVDVISQVQEQLKGSGQPLLTKDATPSSHAIQIEINDYPQKARWKVTHKDTISEVCEMTRTSITTRGTHIPAGKPIKPGERKLYLVIDGDSSIDVERAHNEIKRLLKEATLSAIESDSRVAGSLARYSVV